MKKTAMQELEDAIQNLSSLNGTNKFVIKSLIINFKIKEKQQIIDAVESGGIMVSGEDYYNETFSKKTQK